MSYDDYDYYYNMYEVYKRDDERYHDMINSLSEEEQMMLILVNPALIDCIDEPSNFIKLLVQMK